jgi:hypothetical protein
MIALGADTVLLGRAYLYALATHGRAGVANLLNLIEKEMRVATLTGAKSISEISKDSLVQELNKIPAALAPLSQGMRLKPVPFPSPVPSPRGCTVRRHGRQVFGDMMNTFNTLSP